MKKHFDFLIDEDKNFHKTVLRFYTKQSSVHGFDDIPPNEWDRVYKTYMSFSVLRYYWEDDIDTYETPCKLFSYGGDEGEGLRLLREVLEEMLSEEAKEEYNIVPFGDGVDWEIGKCKRNDKWTSFTMLNDFTGEAYRFYLEQNQIQEFYNVLNEFLEYMLTHSQGI